MIFFLIRPIHQIHCFTVIIFSSAPFLSIFIGLIPISFVALTFLFPAALSIFSSFLLEFVGFPISLIPIFSTSSLHQIRFLQINPTLIIVKKTYSR